MATNYPSGTDSLSNPAGTSLVTSPDHASQHTNINDSMEVVQSTLGTTAGTSILQHMDAGEFPVRHTGVAATGTLQQTLVGGTLDSTTVTTAITANNNVAYQGKDSGGTAQTLIKKNTSDQTLIGENNVRATRFVPVTPVNIVNATNVSNNSYADVDVTAQTSARAFAIVGTCRIRDATVGVALAMRKNGSSTTNNTTYKNMAIVANIGNWVGFEVELDTNQVFEYATQLGATTDYIDIILTGYWEYVD